MAGAAIVVLILFPIIVGVMFDSISDDQTSWDRRFLIFSSVEAIVFAAAGFLFGREVNRQRAEKAEEKNDDAQEARSTAEKAASREETLSESNKKIIAKVLAELPDLDQAIAGPQDTLGRQLPSIPGSDNYQMFVARDPQKANAGLEMLRETSAPGDFGAIFDQLKDETGLQSLHQDQISLSPLADARSKVERIRGMLLAAQ